MSEIKSNRAWREECESLRQRIADLTTGLEACDEQVVALRQPKTAVELPVSEVVQLQNAPDGLWVHFRVGKGYAYSINLDTHQLGNRFANEYRKAVTGSVEPPSQPKMKEVKLLAYLGSSLLYYYREGSAHCENTNLIRQPHLDMIAQVPE